VLRVLRARRTSSSPRSFRRRARGAVRAGGAGRLTSPCSRDIRYVLQARQSCCRSWTTSPRCTTAWLRDPPRCSAGAALYAPGKRADGRPQKPESGQTTRTGTTPAPLLRTRRTRCARSLRYTTAGALRRDDFIVLLPETPPRARSTSPSASEGSGRRRSTWTPANHSS